MFIRKLAIANFAHRKARAALTVAAVALSVSLVVAVTTGYNSVFEGAYTYLAQYMGSSDARVTRLNDPIGVPSEVVQQLRQDPAVTHVDARLRTSTFIPDSSAEAKSGVRYVDLIGVERSNDAHHLDQMRLDAGKWFDGAIGNFAVIDQSVADILHITVGQDITLPHATKTITLKVTGIAHKPAVAAAFMHSIYMPLHTLQGFIGVPDRVSSVTIDLKDNVDRKAFEQRWTEKFDTYKPPLKIHLTSEVRSKMEENLAGLRTMSFMGGATAMLSATFIIFSALSMGVSERQRSLAMLRAVGAFKSQIAGLVVVEGLFLGLLGLLPGIPLGWLFIKVLAMLFPDVFNAGALISWGGVAFGAGGTLLTALAASLLPAWSATRVDPLAAMSPHTTHTSTAAPMAWAVLGLLLICVDPFLFFGPIEWAFRIGHVAQAEAVARAFKFYSHFALGLPCMWFGLFLIAPLCVWLTERMIGPALAAVFGLQFSLLRQQLSSGMWRAAGTCSALMVGLAVLIVMQVSGRSTLNGWQLPDKFPDLFIGTAGGLTDAEVAELTKVPGLADLMPIECASVKWGKFGGNPFAILGSMTVPDETMFIAVDPTKVFTMMHLDFRLGNVEFATEKLKHGGWVMVTEEYRQLKHCQIGDPISLGGHDFRIAAVIWSPGIDVMKAMYDMSDQFEQRTISCVFGSMNDGHNFFGTRPYVFCGEVQKGVPRAEMIKSIKAAVHGMGLQVGDVRDIKDRIQTGFLRLLNMMSTVAFAAMVVASLGVANTITAGVRTRRWQFGILRSIGVTRAGLVRLVLAEAVLLGLIGCVLGLIAGTLMSLNASALLAIIVGYRPPIVIPWGAVGIGLGSVMFISLAASLFPAMDVARTEPLTLLQAGRSST